MSLVHLKQGFSTGGPWTPRASVNWGYKLLFCRFPSCLCAFFLDGPLAFFRFSKGYVTQKKVKKHWLVNYLTKCVNHINNKQELEFQFQLQCNRLQVCLCCGGRQCRPHIPNTRTTFRISVNNIMHNVIFVFSSSIRLTHMQGGGVWDI